MGKKVLLTQAGETLLHYAEKILQEMNTARGALEHLGKWGRGRLRVGASTTACQHILPAVLRKFKDEFPQTLITIEPGDTSQGLELLRSHRVDLVIVIEPNNDEPLDFHPLFSDDLAFIVGPEHPWAALGQAARDEIPKQNYILYNKESYTFRLIEQYFRAENIVLNTVIEFGSMEAIKELVKLGLGVSIIAPWIAARELQEKSLVALPLGKRKLKRNWGIVHWRNRRLTLAEETFIGLCKTAAASLSR
jgi:DNA-binding transcriptional LysR family regulator